ncbi:MAG: HisA/HisF-related TIM barrel protein [Planctomycetaceae bacterium]
MRIIPVIDLLGGIVVRGIGGMRDKYRPITSSLVDSTAPLEVARALTAFTGSNYIYVADLDAIRTGMLSRDVLAELVEDGFQLLLDAGAFEFRQVQLLMDLGVQEVVVGLETLTDPEVLNQATNAFGNRIVFSLDLKASWPITNERCPWNGQSPQQIAKAASDLGVERMIVLDLHRVGRSSGVGTMDLCRELLSNHPGLNIISGGGVRNQDDMDKLNDVGLEGVLVASALHEGNLKSPS